VVVVFGIGALAVGAGACGQQPTGGAQPASTSASARAPVASRSAPAAGREPGRRHRAGRQRLRLLAEPQAGIGPIYRLINDARSSVDLSMYELIDTTAEADLAAAAARGVDVKVILDQHFERSRNTSAYRYLTAHGVHVRWGEPGETYHQKTLTVDGGTSVIMTLNLVTSDYPDTRDFAVIDTDRTDVAAISATFDSDFDGQASTPPDGADLAWSPTNSRQVILSVINGAVHTLAIEDEEMADPAVTSALAAAARRGVDVRIVMTADAEWDQAFTELTRAGVHVRLYPDDSGALYIHAKAIVADAGRKHRRALVGSQNFSVASLDYNRELGIVTSDQALIAGVSATLAGDYARARQYSRPASSSPARAGARCTATATVYNASRNENNVYVHSNQPDSEATASAGGYSHSYRTDGSGYALIYLNGPPPGARITVTVGGATCHARD
jgi:phosphatidylserine/phosphatidylglycerophosphate/cardiolipin synthase-like enzyme